MRYSEASRTIVPTYLPLRPTQGGFLDSASELLPLGDLLEVQGCLFTKDAGRSIESGRLCRCQVELVGGRRIRLFSGLEERLMIHPSDGTSNSDG